MPPRPVQDGEEKLERNTVTAEEWADLMPYLASAAASRALGDCLFEETILCGSKKVPTLVKVAGPLRNRNFGTTVRMSPLPFPTRSLDQVNLEMRADERSNPSLSSDLHGVRETVSEPANKKLMDKLFKAILTNITCGPAFISSCARNQSMSEEGNIIPVPSEVSNFVKHLRLLEKAGTPFGTYIRNQQFKRSTPLTGYEELTILVEDLAHNFEQKMEKAMVRDVETVVDRKVFIERLANLLAELSSGTRSGNNKINEALLL